jgi:hypothetical protein
MVVKLVEAAEHAVSQFWNSKAMPGAYASPIQQAITAFREAYDKPLTSAMYIAGE